MIGRLARLSDGSPGLARELADPALWAFRKKVFDALGGGNADGPALAAEWQSLAEAAGKESGAQRRRATLVLRLLVDGFRQVLGLCVNLPVPAADSNETRMFKQVADKLGADGIIRRLERCLDADMQTDRRVQLVLVIEGLVDSLVYGG
jgi:DNA polymerase-3 subunit delta'